MIAAGQTRVMTGSISRSIADTEAPGTSTVVAILTG